jgi:hypothetical protein
MRRCATPALPPPTGVAQQPVQSSGLRCVVVEDATFSAGEMHERGLARACTESVIPQIRRGRELS